MVLSGTNKVSSSSSMTNQTSHFGIMGGLAPSVGLASGARMFRLRRGKNKQQIPTGSVPGLQHMKEHDILSKNPAGSGGIGLTKVLVDRSMGPCNCGAPGVQAAAVTASPLYKTLNTSYNNSTGKDIYAKDSGILLSVFDFGPGTDATSTRSIDDNMGWNYGDTDMLVNLSPTWSDGQSDCTGLGYTPGLVTGPTSPPNPKLSILCPPYTGPKLRCQNYWDYGNKFPLQCTQSGKVISFSYIRKDLATMFSNTWTTEDGPLQAPLAFITGWSYGPYAIIYDNSSKNEKLKDQLFCSYAGDGGTGARAESAGTALACSKSNSGVPDPFCSKLMCSTPGGVCIDTNMLESYKANIKNKEAGFDVLTSGGMYNEVVVKSWNHDADGPSGSCFSADWTDKEKNAWGWSDALKDKPILAFAVITGVHDEKEEKASITKLKKILSDTPFATSIVRLDVAAVLGKDPFSAV